MVGTRVMSDEQAVLSANEAFYRAFAESDLPAMAALWSQRAPVACIHPGWNPLTDREAVMASWAGILGGPISVAWVRLPSSPATLPS